MLFNSLEFALFVPIVFALYWVFYKSVKVQNSILLLAGYVFYGWWDYRFLSLIILSSFIDYFVSLRIAKVQSVHSRKGLLAISILFNLGMLGFFKYFNFFAQEFSKAFTFFGASIEGLALDIILPVGISFYTFQTMSYTIDVFRRKIEPTRDIIAFFSFVNFFPQLVAGPIERASHLLPQFIRPRAFSYQKSADGMRQILWGLFKKIVIADNCAVIVNDIFANYETQSGSTLFIGAIFFAFQIYGDFSGYSDIAIGTSQLFGFNLKKNFNFPYFSRDIAEFWRRWHISLSSWFKDYVYIPLGGSRGSRYLRIRNTLIIFVVSGFWHGANWTFIFWGLLNALYFIPLLLLGNNRSHTNNVAEDGNIPTFKEFRQILLTFVLTCIAWVFFRAETVDIAMKYVKNIFSSDLFTIPNVPFFIIPILMGFILVEWFQRKNEHGLVLNTEKTSKFFRWGIYYGVVFLILWYSGEPQEFIYFKF